MIPADQRAEEIGSPSDPDHPANMATFWARVRQDHEFRPIFDRRMRIAQRETSDLLRAALTEGELVACDPDEIGRTLTADRVGTAMLWPGDNAAESLVARVGKVFDTIVGPYRA